MAKSSKERVAAYRDRLKSGTIVPECGCGRQLKGSLSKKRQLCKKCYDQTLIKKHRVWLRDNACRGREVLTENLQAWGNYKVGGEAIASDGSKGTVQAIASYINGNVSAAVTFEDGDQDIFLISPKNP
jgi:hypothetical protein